jgi:4-alpha-glucanotransferase
MSDDALRQLADAAGLLTRWIDYRGEHHGVDAGILRAILHSLEIPCDTEAQVRDSAALVESERTLATRPPMVVAQAGEPIPVGAVGSGQDEVLCSLVLEDGRSRDITAMRGSSGQLTLPAISEPGYHRIEMADEAFTLAVTPARCVGIGDLAGSRRLWGLTAQLYSLRRRGDGGIGDFTALAQLARDAARHGADAIAVSPVHALFSADIHRFSPYSPSSRLFVNVLHADPAEAFGESMVREAIAAAGLAERWAALEALPLVDWPAAARAKLDVLRHLYEHMPAATPALRQDFRRYCNDAGPALRDHARFEALHAHFFSGETPCWNWREWPEAYRDSESNEVSAFARRHADDVRFHCFMQWLADRGLGAAQAAARESGMAVGLISDLAVGTDGGGSHGWSRRHDMLMGVGVGAPPDLINALGQNWGLTTFSPRALRLHGYAPFLEMLRAQLRHAGGLRIDHVLGLGRLWLVPEGAKATEGAYLRYPVDDLFRLIALESLRHRAVIIGEDMGTVPEGFRDRLGNAGILGMRVLWFERDWGLFIEPSRWPAGAVAMTTTHDLPTVAGWWQGRDIDWRARLGHFGPHSDEARDRAARSEDRSKLWSAFCYNGVAAGDLPATEDAKPVVDAAVAFIARTPSPLSLLPVEDALGLVEQPNVPGTTDEHPNWRRRLPGDAEALLDSPEVTSRLKVVDRERRGS